MQHQYFAERNIIRSIVMVVLSVLALSALVVPTQNADAMQMINNQQLLEEVNVLRIQHGLTPLILDEQLTTATYSKAENMNKYSYFAHVSPYGVTPWDWIDNSGYKFRTAGENLAMGFSDAKSIVNAWSNSDLHRANLLNPNFKDVGFSVHTIIMNGRQQTLIVQMLATRL